MQILNTQSQYSYTIWGKVDWDAWTITRDRGLFYNVKCHYINLQLWCNCIILNANLSHHNNPEYLWIYNKIVYLLLLFSHQIMPDSSQPHHDPFESLTAARQASLLHTISQSLHKFTSSDWWCHPAISPSVALFSFCLQSFPVEESFRVSQFFSSSGQIVGVPASGSVLPMSMQSWLPLRLTGLISLIKLKRHSRVFSSTTVRKHQFFGALPSLLSGSHNHTWLLERLYRALTILTFAGKVIALLFNTLSRFVIAFLPGSHCLLISWLQSLSTVILEPKGRGDLSLLPPFLLLFAMKWWDQMPQS